MKRMYGYTLMEMMIVVVIIGILASIAYPSYQEHVRSSKRASAQATLMELAQFMERHYTAHGRYTTADSDAPTLPFDKVPRDSATASYTLALSRVDDFSYALVATPVNDMSDDKCGHLVLTDRGGKSSSRGAPTDCWRQ